MDMPNAWYLQITCIFMWTTRNTWNAQFIFICSGAGNCILFDLFVFRCVEMCWSVRTGYAFAFEWQANNNNKLNKSWRKQTTDWKQCTAHVRLEQCNRAQHEITTLAWRLAHSAYYILWQIHINYYEQHPRGACAHKVAHRQKQMCGPNDKKQREKNCKTHTQKIMNISTPIPIAIAENCK